jgi:putative PIN family toxin of toxin-antitoxin system
MVAARVVLDTNVLVSATRYGGTPLKVLDAARDGSIDAVVSLHILGELRRVLVRPHLGFPPSDVDLFAVQLAGFCDVLVTDAIPAQWSADPDDDAIVQTALLGEAHYIVSGDANLLDLRIPGVRIVTPAAMMAILRG